MRTTNIRPEETLAEAAARQGRGHRPYPRRGAAHRRPAVRLAVEHATPGPIKGLGAIFFAHMRPKGEPAIRTVQGHAHQCRPCPTITGASNKSRENRLDLPGFLRKPEQISRFSRHRAPDGATASHTHGQDCYGHAPKKRPPYMRKVDFAERRIGSLRAEKAPPRRSGNPTRPSCPNFEDCRLRNSDAPDRASRVPAKSVGRHGKP